MPENILTNKKNDMKEEVTKYIIEANIKKALKVLRENISDEEILNQVIIISSWHSRLSQSELNGIPPNLNEYQKITKSILEIINKVDSVSNTNRNSVGKIIFERNLKIVELPIPSLDNKILSFQASVKNTRSGQEKELKLSLLSRNINIYFKCSSGLTIKELKNLILTRFSLKNYIEYNSILEIEWALTINGIIYKNESKSLRANKINHRDTIGLKKIIKFKKNEQIVNNEVQTKDTLDCSISCMMDLVQD